MKKILALAFMALSATFYSCSSDSESSTSTSAMSAKIDGQLWSTQFAVASVTETDFDTGGMALQILGAKSDNSAFTIVIPLTNLSEGNHTYSGFDAKGSLGYFTPALDSYTSSEDQGTFTVNITDIDLDAGKISGTFSGTLISFDDETTSISITEGKFIDITMISQSLYSNGSMSLSKNGGTAFEMDENQDDSKYLLLNENSIDNSLTMIGYNTTLTTDFGIYTLSIPLDVAQGTYSLTNSSDFKAGFASEDGAPEYEITTGTISITSHNNNNVIGTFSFTADNGSSTVTITNGSFNVTHL